MDEQIVGKNIDFSNILKGQAVGGPGLKSKLTMWDVMTLYDTQKKKLEDEMAFLEQKQ